MTPTNKFEIPVTILPKLSVTPVVSKPLSNDVKKSPILAAQLNKRSINDDAPSEFTKLNTVLLTISNPFLKISRIEKRPSKVRFKLFKRSSVGFSDSQNVLNCTVY